MEQELQEFGLTDKETKVYLALLRLGNASVQEVAKKAGTYRTYTYEILKSLQEKGLVFSVIKSRIQYFEIAKPERLLTILDEKKNIIHNLLPKLNQLYGSSSGSTQAQVYTGKEGLKTILNDFIKTGKEILAYGSCEMQVELLQYHFMNYIQRRIDANIKIKVIAEHSDAADQIHTRDKQELREMRFLPKPMQFPTINYIYGNKVAMICLEQEPFGVVIENNEIVRTQKIIFNLLWKLSSKH